MTLRTHNHRANAPDSRGFTLVELMFVLMLLATVVALVAPSLSRFFHGRSVDSEARRFLALAHHAQSRAVAEGVPMILWIDSEKRTYGLHAETGYVESDPDEVEFPWSDRVMFAATMPEDVPVTAAEKSVSRQPESGAMTMFYFLPDGYISDQNPVRVRFYEGEDERGGTLVGLSRNRLSYEIQTPTE